MIKPRRVAWHDQEWRKEWHRQHPPTPYRAAEPTTPQLTTCPRCGHPAQREEAPNGETYITCGHCAAIAFDGEQDSEFYAQAERPVRIAGHMTCECALCCRVQRCFHNGETWVCCDRQACEAYTAPLSPVEALRLALERGVFGLPETVAKLREALDAADQEALTRAEQLAATRASVAINLEMRKIEAAIFDLPC